jgi:hypothetical protein
VAPIFGACSFMAPMFEIHMGSRDINKGRVTLTMNYLNNFDNKFLNKYKKIKNIFL